MNKEDFYNELGNIDPEYIEEAELSAQPSKKVFKMSAKKWIAAAAAFIIMAGAASTSEAVQAAIKKMFTFIPGIGIEESTESTSPSNPEILYSMEGDPVTKSNDLMSVTLENAYVSSYSVDIVYRIKLNFIPDDFVSPEEMQKILDENGVSSYIEVWDTEGLGGYTFLDVNPEVTVNGKTYSDLQNYCGGSVNDMTYTVRAVSEDIAELGENLPVTFKIGDLSFDIKFKPIETYDTVDEIGPTAMHNGISVTAVPRWDNDILYIKFYALNYSEFDQTYGYISYEGENTVLPYVTVGTEKINAQYEGGDGTEFYFDLSSYGLSEEQKAEIELHAPIIVVRNNENTVIDFKVNDDGTIDHPDKVRLSNCELDISEMKVSAEKDWENGIEMSFTAVNDSENIRLSSVSLTEVNGKSAGGAGSWTYNEGNKWNVGFQSDSIKKAKDYKSIKISSAEYTLTDEYVFSFK